MKSRVLIVILGVVAALAASTGSALAKGIQRATVTGPKLESPLVFRMNDPYDGVEALVGETGIYPSLFETEPNPVVQSQPVDELGPRYEIEYVMKVPGRSAAVVHQDVYPYTPIGPVTHTAAGQPVIDGGTSVGGWYLSGPRLLPLLVSKGLPEPASDPASGPIEEPSGLPAILTVAGVTILLAAVLATGRVVRRRRRPRTASA
jgi:hypothetical protein